MWIFFCRHSTGFAVRTTTARNSASLSLHKSTCPTKFKIIFLTCFALGHQLTILYYTFSSNAMAKNGESEEKTTANSIKNIISALSNEYKQKFVISNFTIWIFTWFFFFFNYIHKMLIYCFFFIEDYLILLIWLKIDFIWFRGETFSYVSSSNETHLSLNEIHCEENQKRKKSTFLFGNDKGNMVTFVMESA